MEFIKAKISNTDRIYDVIQNTIKTIYPKYYPQSIVEFFCGLHAKENIIADIENEYVYILLCDNRLIGTGTYIGNHMTRVFVAPEFQGRGYGSYIMRQLESKIALTHNTACLDASLAANILYEHRGYKTAKHEQIAVGNEILVYEIMEKELK